MEQALAARTSELSSANERLSILDRSKNDFLNLISHEFRTPLNCVLGVAEIILDQMSSTEANDELKEAFDGSRRQIMSILGDALLLTQIDVSRERFKCTPVFLQAALNDAIKSVTAFAESRDVTFTIPPANLDLVRGCEELLFNALRALLETAVKFSAKGTTVTLARDVAPESRRVIIDSHGWTIPGPALVRFFDLFAIGETLTPGGDLGLGPYLASRILSLFGGSVSVVNRDSCGIRLTISLNC